MEPVAGLPYTAVVHIVTMLLQEMTHWIHLLFFCLVGSPLFAPGIRSLTIEIQICKSRK